MIDKSGFLKLFGITIPTIDHFDYYIDQLSKYRKWRNIKEYIPIWRDMEEKFGDTSGIIDSTSSQIVEFLNGSNALSELNFDKNIIDFPSSRSLKYDEDSKYISISLKNSNWMSLKKYDPDHINELGVDWPDLLDRFGVPEVFKFSNNYRNLIFSKLDSKKISKVQRNIVQDIVREYQDDFLVEGVRNDEVIFKFENFSELSRFEDLHPNYQSKVFTISRKSGYRVDTIYDIHGKFIDRELINLDSSLFFLKLKEHITGEELNIRDFYFDVDGRLAIWFDRRLNMKLD